MNKQRRARLQEAVDILTKVRDEEQEAYDNLPEGLQGSEKGEAMEGAISNIDEAVSQIEEVIES